MAGAGTLAGWVLLSAYSLFASPSQLVRERAKIVVFMSMLALLTAVVGAIVFIVLDFVEPPGNVLVLVVALSLLPMAYFSVKRGLFTVSRMVNHTLVYVALTGSIVALYVLLLGSATASVNSTDASRSTS